MNNCRNCKFAEWTLAKNGRVNVNKVGMCRWAKVFHVPLSYNGLPIRLTGGFIWPKNPKEKCPTFQERPE